MASSALSAVSPLTTISSLTSLKSNTTNAIPAANRRPISIKTRPARAAACKSSHGSTLGGDCGTFPFPVYPIPIFGQTGQTGSTGGDSGFWSIHFFGKAAACNKPSHGRTLGGDHGSFPFPVYPIPIFGQTGSTGSGDSGWCYPVVFGKAGHMMTSSTDGDSGFWSIHFFGKAAACKSSHGSTLGGDHGSFPFPVYPIPIFGQTGQTGSTGSGDSGWCYPVVFGKAGHMMTSSTGGDSGFWSIHFFGKAAGHTASSTGGDSGLHPTMAMVEEPGFASN
ncbi:unnamed protein product [Linum trigynum]|uniref:Uncharacterized protein n=1 Tax=Linum trigynum TaxID=586398 RepID=A0AAV2D5D4_9ROSI